MPIRCLLTGTDRSEALAQGSVSARAFLQASLDRAADPGIELVLNPAAADVILFAEWHGNEGGPDDVARVRASSLYRAHRDKVVIHSGKDVPRPLIPGLYPSLSQRACRLLGCQGAPYLHPTNPFIEELDGEGEPSLLASFMGSAPGKPVRVKLLDEATQRRWQDVVVRDTTAAFIGTLRAGDAAAHDEMKRQFARDLLAAKFALCPAGAGLSSFRVFEAMEARRAPVIIADGWAAPPGPDWATFAIRVPECEIRHLPALLREREGEWSAMGERARAAWEGFYGPRTLGPMLVRQADAVRAAAAPRRTFITAAAGFYVHGLRRGRLARQSVGARLARLGARSRPRSGQN